jgi:hypothetical protein
MNTTTTNIRNLCKDTSHTYFLIYDWPWLRYLGNCAVKVKVMLRPRSVGPIYLSVKPHLGPMTRFLLLPDNFGFVDVGRPLWREDGSVVYKCCWTSPAGNNNYCGLVDNSTVVYRILSNNNIRITGKIGFDKIENLRLGYLLKLLHVYLRGCSPWNTEIWPKSFEQFWG